MPVGLSRLVEQIDKDVLIIDEACIHNWVVHSIYGGSGFIDAQEVVDVKITAYFLIIKDHEFKYASV